MRIIAGTWKGRALQTPKNNLTRPTSDRIREALFSALESRIQFDEAHVLDIFAGTGALGLEALSRGAASCYFVEKINAACAVIESNIHALNATDKTHLLKCDAVRLGKHEKQAPLFNLVFLDPPMVRGLRKKHCNVCKRAAGWHRMHCWWWKKISAQASYPSGFDEIYRRAYGDTEITLLSNIS